MHLVHEMAARRRGNVPRILSFNALERGIGHTFGAALQRGTKVINGVEVGHAVAVWRQTVSYFRQPTDNI